MAFLLYLLPPLACCQLAMPHPLNDGGNSVLGPYGTWPALASQDASTPMTKSLLTTLLLTDFPRDHGELNKRRKLDTTFIRFGRGYEQNAPQQNGGDSSGRPDEGPGYDPSETDVEVDASSNGSSETLVPQEQVQGGGTSSQSRSRPFKGSCRMAAVGGPLLRVLIPNNPCVRMPQKVKRQNVNDTFIRFGKRVALRLRSRRMKRVPSYSR